MQEMDVKIILKIVLTGLFITALLSVTVPSEGPLPADFVREANAIIGLPFTPFSFAGVARRTCRRAARRALFYSAAGAATVGAAATTHAVTHPQPAPAPAPVHHAAAPAIGTVVQELPAGCVSTHRDDIEFFNCGGVCYRPAFQSGNLVYVVQNPG
jgi:hypothetical protein